MDTFDILHSDQEGFEVTEKCCCFVLFSSLSYSLMKNDVIPPVNDGFSSVFLDMAL